MTEHPIETARRALLEAAKFEDDEMAHLLRRMARSLPDRSRAPLRKLHPPTDIRRGLSLVGPLDAA
jgi:hypothetical protein